MDSILEHYDNKVVAAYTLDLLSKNQQRTNGDKKMGVVKHLRKIELQVRESHENLNRTQKTDSIRLKIPIPKKIVPQSTSIPAVITEHSNQGAVKPRSTTSSGSTIVNSEAQRNAFEIPCIVRNIDKDRLSMIDIERSRKYCLNQKERTSKISSSSTPVDQKESKGKSCLKEGAPASLVFTPRLHKFSTPDLEKFLASRQRSNSSKLSDGYRFLICTLLFVTCMTFYYFF